jgi:polysaccharide biosynthesis/export protein
MSGKHPTPVGAVAPRAGVRGPREYADAVTRAMPGAVLGVAPQRVAARRAGRYLWPAFPGRRGRPFDASRIRRPLPRSFTTLFAAALLWLGALAPARAQTASPRPAAPPAVPLAVPTAQDDTSHPNVSSLPVVPAMSGPLVDAPVSRATYPLGPGDILAVAVFGEFSHVYNVAVTPEGTVVIPEVGIARVLGLNLDQAQERVRQVVARLYRDVDVTVTLARIRAFKVFVVGDVTTPGVRSATAATRVSEVVPEARADNIWRRNLLLRRASGDSIRVDLARFMLLGDPSANPTLLEGDAVMVPPVDLRIDTYGGLRFTGSYEYRPGESLADFLYVANAGGGFPSNSADTVRLTRFVDGGGRRSYAFSQAEAMGPPGRAFALQPFDALYLATVSNFKVQRTAEVTGEVVHPGWYPVRSDTTTVRELVEMAGGFTPRASLTQARLTRTPPAATRGEQQLREVPPELLTREELQILQVRTMSDPSSVVIDFRQLFAAGNDAYRQTVRAGDKLDVPERRSEVVVLGAVRQPGIVSFMPGQTAAAYVARAGGATRRADLAHAVVIRAHSGLRERVSENHWVDEGDTVILPYRREHEASEVIRTAASVLSAVTGLIVSVVYIFR